VSQDVHLGADVSAQLLADAFNAFPVGLALWDAGDRLRLANRWFEDAYGVSAADAPTWEQMVRGCHARQRGVLIETDDIDAWVAAVRRSYRQVPVRAFESDLCDGRWVRVVETLRGDGSLLTTISDVSTLKATEAALRLAHEEAVRVSMRDPLTDLPNRRDIFARLGEMLTSSNAMRWPLSLAMIDIDHFKRINDSEGHAVGDAVLCHFAKLLTSRLRPMDAVGRIGGEEFLLLLPNATLDGVVQMLSRVRELIEASVAAPISSLPPYTFSAGVVESRPGESADALFRRADRALYRAKQGGRDQSWAENSLSMRL
jgi:diguanylate cyclase (GGDEF)-like protein